MTHINQILITLIKTMIEDLKRRSYDESGEQKAETEQRIDTLIDLLNELRTKDKS